MTTNDFGAIREAFNRKWLWPAADQWGWSHPKDNWQAIEDQLDRLGINNKNTVNQGICLQAGGCCGMYPWLLSQMFSTVYTFELDPTNFSYLVSNLLGVTNVIASNFALGDEHIMVKTDPAKRLDFNVGHHHATEVGKNCNIPTLRIDDLELPRLDALLLDAEGYEGKIINGAMATLARTRPRIIIIETLTPYLVEQLESLSYKEQTPEGMYDHVFTR